MMQVHTYHAKRATVLNPACTPSAVMSADRDDSNSAHDPLRVVLEHLSGPDGSTKSYNTVARGLHRASKQYHAAVRCTVRQLILHAYRKRIAEVSSSNPADIFRNLFAACPALTYLQLDEQHLEGFAQGAVQQPSSAGHQLRHVKVFISSRTKDAGLQGLGRLLRGCSQLQQVDVTYLSSNHGFMSNPHLMLDPDSSSLADAMPPAAPLRVWTSHKVPSSVLARWAAQQPLGRTLRSLTMTFAGPIVDLGQLTPLTGITHLHLSYYRLTSSSSLSSFSRLQSLGLMGRMDDVAAVQTLTGLQSLSVHTGTRPSESEAHDSMATDLFNALQPLRQLTHLHVIHRGLSEVPEALGELPCLWSVRFSSCCLTTVPSSLTSLKRLELVMEGGAVLALPPTLTCLRTLLIKSEEAYLTDIPGLSALTALEFLAVEDTSVFYANLSSLQPLTRLCHLDLTDSRVEPARLTVIGALQQLTYLSLRSPALVLRPVATLWSGLAVAAPLPALQQLDISCRSGWGDGWLPLATLGPWLAGCTALTKLAVTGSDVSSDDQLLYLSAGLQELALGKVVNMELQQQLPCGLSRLSALRVLDVSENGSVCELPSMLSVLQRLEALSLAGTGVVSEQAVLAQMPMLERVALPWRADAAVVFGQATHLVKAHVSVFEG